MLPTLKSIGAATVITLLLVGTVSCREQGKDASEAEVGDCLGNVHLDESDPVSDAEVVDCSSEDAQFKVVDETTGGSTFGCESSSYSLTISDGHTLGTMLCLEEVG